MFVRSAYRSTIIATLLLTGCGGGGISVTGKVAVNGQPLENGEIMFVPVDKGEPEGAPISAGQYSLLSSKRLAAEEYQVQIRSYRGSGKKRWDGMGEEDNPNKTMVEDMVQFIPSKYNDISEMRIKLKAGTNTYDAALEVP